MTDLSLWQVALVIFAVGFSVLAIKVAITFNVTDWLKRRDEKNQTKVKIVCPHVTMGQESDGRYYVDSLAVSPPGTTQAQCQQCGQVLIGGLSQADDIATFYQNNPAAYVTQMKKYRKAVRKAYGR